MTRGPLGYGRYDSDPEHVGCPHAKTDMTPCAARDGQVATYSTPLAMAGHCVGCEKHAADLLRDLVREVTAP